MKALYFLHEYTTFHILYIFCLLNLVFLKKALNALLHEALTHENHIPFIKYHQY